MRGIRSLIEHRRGRALKAATAAIAVLLVFASLQMPGLLGAWAASYCQIGQSPQFGGGFAALQDQLGDAMGTPLECEHIDARSGDTLVTTSTGLAFYRRQTNTPTFTDGFNHYALTTDGLISWTGTSIDPPGSCVEPYDQLERACTLAANADMLGYLRTPGETNVYAFNTVDPATYIDAMLQDLPAAYDLYLVDASSAVIAASVLDGLDPRTLHISLSDPGMYYLYVVSDPAGAADPDNPYRLVFAQTSPGQRAAAADQFASGSVDASPVDAQAPLMQAQVPQPGRNALLPRVQTPWQSTGAVATPTLSPNGAYGYQPPSGPGAGLNSPNGGRFPNGGQGYYPTPASYPTQTYSTRTPSGPPTATPTPWTQRGGGQPTATPYSGPAPIADTLPPTTTSSLSPSPNSAGWFDRGVSSVTVQLSSVDTAPSGASPSGVRTIAFTATGAQPIAYTTIFGSSATLPPITAEGITTISYYAVDNAGNSEEPKTTMVKIDRSRPASIATFVPTPGPSGWNTHSVTVTLSATDAWAANGSGVRSITYSATGAQPMSQTTVYGSVAVIPAINVEGKTTISWFATDNAGNQEGTHTHTVQIDNTPPVVTIATPVSGAQVSGFASLISGAATDTAGGSGVDFVSVSLQRRSNNLYWSGVAWQPAQTWLKTTLTGANWKTSDPMPSGSSAAPGAYRVCADAVDLAANHVVSPVCVDFSLAGAVATVPISSSSAHGPTGLAANPNTSTAYVADSGTGQVSVINTATNAVTATLSVGASPQGVAVNTATNTIYVANSGINTISVIDGATNHVTPVTVGVAPQDVAVSGNAVYVTSSHDNAVSVVNATSNAVVATIGVGANPSGIGVNSTTNRVYVANTNSNSVSVIDAATNTRIQDIGVGSRPKGIAVDATHNRVYVANSGDGTVSVINGASNTVIATPTVGNGPSGVAVNTLTDTVFVTNSSGNSVSVINGTTNTVSATMTAGAGPQGIAVNASKNLVYIANFGDGTVSVIGT